MTARQQDAEQTMVMDLIIIGGGIGGVICLKYAVTAGLNAMLLERGSALGGIWRELPAWQDIQIRKEDWTLGRLPMDGEDQASVLRNIQAWVEHYALESAIRLNAQVTCARPVAEGWEVCVGEKVYRSRFLVAATGGHNRPTVPQVERRASTIMEYHSSALASPGEITGRDVIVVGGGASAYDLLDLCVEHGARKIVWVYRTLKWMRPTQQSKHAATNMRLLAKQQMLGVPVEKINLAIHQDLQSRYAKAGLQDILPDVAFDLRRHQLIPGRRHMIREFKRIERYRSEIVRIDGSAS